VAVDNEALCASAKGFLWLAVLPFAFAVLLPWI